MFIYIKKASVMFIYYFIFVTISFFLSPFLIINKGISTETIGFLTVIGYALLLIAFLGLGYIADKINSSKKIIVINLFLTILLFLTLIISQNKDIIIISYILTYPIFISLTSLLDDFILNDIKEKNYAYIRSIGSLGAAISYFINSVLMTNFNYTYIMILQTVLISSLLIIMLISYENENFKKSNISYSEGIHQLKNHKEIFLLLIITFLTYGTLSADDAYTYMYNIEIVQISNFVYGLCGFLSIGLEFILMISYNILNNILYVTKFLYVSAISLFFIYLTKYLCTDYPSIIIMGNVLLGIFTGLFIPIAVYTITQYSDIKIRNTMLGLYQISIKLGALIIGFITALNFAMTDNLPDIYLLHTVLIAFSLIFIYLLSRTMKKDNSK